MAERGYIVSAFDNSREAVKYLASQIDGKTVGFGGSVSLEEMGLYEKLISHNDNDKSVDICTNKPEIRNNSAPGLGV